MLNPRQRFGQDSESAAVAFLEKMGYEIVARNYRTRAGEIDIIATEGEKLVFVEVKARHTERYGHPKWAITPAKRRRISMAALYYLKATRQMNRSARFDVLTIQKGQGGQKEQGGQGRQGGDRIEIIRNAFELAYR